jgi:hypothetical protein
MNIPSPHRTTTLGFIAAAGLVFSSVAFAQGPHPAPPGPPAGESPSAPVAPATSPQLLVTQTSRIRAFFPGPSGEVHSLYLQNGSAVDVTPALGDQLGPAIRKGEKITVTGTESEIKGQSVVEATSVRLNDETFSANAPAPRLPGRGARAEGTVPPQTSAPQAPSPRRKNKSAAPCEAPAEAPPPPDLGGPPPPPPDGMGPPPPPPDGMPPPPPPQE